MAFEGIAATCTYGALPAVQRAEAADEEGDGAVSAWRFLIISFSSLSRQSSIVGTNYPISYPSCVSVFSA